jgi:hypothetical protein
VSLRRHDREVKIPGAFTRSLLAGDRWLVSL